jgi:hypothetical protein
MLEVNGNIKLTQDGIIYATALPTSEQIYLNSTYGNVGIKKVPSSSYALDVQ